MNNTKKRLISWRRRWPIRSIGVNFALAYSVVFLISASIFLSFTWWSTTNLLNRHVQNAIETDASDLTHRWRVGGPRALTHAIKERLDQNVDDDALYLLVDGLGRRLAGNLPGWPVKIQKTDHYYELPIKRYSFRTTAKFRVYKLTKGYRLIIGHDVKGRELFRHIITETLVWCALMVSILALGGAFVVRRLFRHVVFSIARTTRALANGDLNHRIALDGSETDLVAETINAMLERINRLMDGVKQVSNAIAHDLRTPIARARTRLEDAIDHAKSEEELREAVSLAVGDLDNITLIFEALLRIAQIEAGAKRSAFAEVDLNKLLENMAEFYSVSAEEAGLNLALNASSLPTIIGDKSLLQQAIANLLDNAIKFTPQGGTITLEAHTIPLESTSPDSIKISVRDEGVGMAEKDINRAHERFFRAESARNTPGSGLGLSLVQAIMSLHKGSLSLQNEQPGLRVILTLPLSDS
ncbi:HAMP domain-containing protein [Aristophania vespae]|uniref:histidine kinase n=1 Tax=Aristophania vespae TaxID=2697033 RepID=A0A6P1NMB3_9PROT|nr:HAMP domain-containing sensor histidine kinase [Aristophania vespae]QHI95991.1 HAMP domain-containing protein [Aristophania vespae]UMM63747.1 Adaptive-response sensory-kinase SasA [Aristophania vespae]